MTVTGIVLGALFLAGCIAKWFMKTNSEIDRMCGEARLEEIQRKNHK